MNYRQPQTRAEKQDEARRMREQREQGATLKQIAVRFRLSEAGVCRILKGNRRVAPAPAQAGES